MEKWKSWKTNGEFVVPDLGRRTEASRLKMKGQEIIGGREKFT